MKRNVWALFCCVGGWLVVQPLAAVGDAPPADGKPLSEILQVVEKQPATRVAEVEFDDGRWEVKACDAAGCQKLEIDPRTGEVARRRSSGRDELPAADAKPLSAIARWVEASGQGVIEEIEFDDGVWEVDVRKDGRKAKLVIDPVSGEPRR